MGRNTRLLIFWVCSVICGGCSHAPATPSGPTQWQRVSRVDGCASFKSYRGRPYDISIVLKPELQEQLAAQLAQHTLEEPLCWYEQPSGDLLLRAGPFCGFPKEAVFRQDGNSWSLVGVEKQYIQCDQRAR